MTGWIPRRAWSATLSALGLVALAACGRPAGGDLGVALRDQGVTGADLGPEPEVVARLGRLATWGSTTLFVETDEGRLEVLENVLRLLAEERGEQPIDLVIGYGSDCDPRQSLQLCNLGPSSLQFFVALGSAFTIEVEPLSTLVASADRGPYDVLVVDPCQSLLSGELIDQLAAHLEAGGRLLVLADNRCSDGVLRANTLTSNYGIVFLSDGAAGTLEVPPNERTGILDGIDRLHLSGLHPQLVAEPARALVALDGEQGLVGLVEIDPEGGRP